MLFFMYLLGQEHNSNEVILMMMDVYRLSIKVYIISIRLFRIMSIPIMFRLFRVLTSEMLGRLLPVFTLFLWQRQHIIVVDAVDYK
jgi:hypothetical protein